MEKLKLIIGLIIYYLLILLSPILKIRFGYIYASRVGHLAFNVDHYLSHSKQKKTISVFGFQKKISNKYLFNTWEKFPNIFFTNKFLFIYNLIKKINPKSFLLIDYDVELHPVFSTTSLSKRNLPELNDKENLFSKFLKKNKINGPFICINNRNIDYLKYEGLEDGNFHSFRNFEFEALSKTIDYLIKKNYFVIRIGKHKKNNNYNNQKFIDLNENEDNELLELILLEKCFFYIGCNTGISVVPRLFRKPVLLINYIPFNIREMSAWSAYSIYIPKKLRNKITKKFLTFKEMNDIKYDLHFDGNFFSQNNLDVIDNSPIDILKATIEMEKKLKNCYTQTYKSKLLQTFFWDSLKKIKNIDEIRNNLKLKISDDFLIDNENLIR